MTRKQHNRRDIQQWIHASRFAKRHVHISPQCWKALPGAWHLYDILRQLIKTHFTSGNAQLLWLCLISLWCISMLCPWELKLKGGSLWSCRGCDIWDIALMPQQAFVEPTPNTGSCGPDFMVQPETSCLHPPDCHDSWLSHKNKNQQSLGLIHKITRIQ